MKHLLIILTITLIIFLGCDETERQILSSLETAEHSSILTVPPGHPIKKGIASRIGAATTFGVPEWLDDGGGHKSIEDMAWHQGELYAITNRWELRAFGRIHPAHGITHLWKVNRITGTLSQVGTIRGRSLVRFCTGLASDGATLYIITEKNYWGTGGRQPELGALSGTNLLTYTEIGSLDFPEEPDIGDLTHNFNLTFDGSHLYTRAKDYEGNYFLCTVDRITGIATRITPYKQHAFVYGLVSVDPYLYVTMLDRVVPGHIDPDDIQWPITHDEYSGGESPHTIIDDGGLYRLDKITGALTRIGDTPNFGVSFPNEGILPHDGIIPQAFDGETLFGTSTSPHALFAIH